MDDSPAWSHDDKLIAFHRRFASQYGPAGVYLTRVLGGTNPTLIYQGDFSGPKELCFSGDDRHLVASWGGRLLIIDLQTLIAQAPFYTNNGAVQPNWNPLTDAIVYSRAGLDPGEPQDSAGIHIYHTSSGIDSCLRYHGQFVVGSHAKWYRDGIHLLFSASFPTLAPTESGIYTLDVVRDKLVHLTDTPPVGYYDYPQWFPVPFPGPPNVLYRRNGKNPIETFIVRADGLGNRLRRPRLGPYDAVSHDGWQVAMVLQQPQDSLGVLYIVPSQSQSLASRRQLTEWLPPTATGVVPS